MIVISVKKKIIWVLIKVVIKLYWCNEFLLCCEKFGFLESKDNCE